MRPLMIKRANWNPHGTFKDFTTAGLREVLRNCPQAVQPHGLKGLNRKALEAVLNRALQSEHADRVRFAFDTVRKY